MSDEHPYEQAAKHFEGLKFQRSPIVQAAADAAAKRAAKFAYFRFDFIAAAMAWDASRQLNGSSHETTRALASRLEFAQARLHTLRHGGEN